MNIVTLMGRLTKDPVVRYTQSEQPKAVANYDLAVDRIFKRDGEPDADFFRCVVWGKQAEFAEKYLHKGSRVAVCGRLQNDSYTNKDGVKVYTVEVVVNSQEFAESKAEADARSGKKEEPSDDFMEIDEEEIAKIFG